MPYQRKRRSPEGDFGTVGGPGDRDSGGCLGPAVGRTEHGSPIAPAAQLAGAIGESALHRQARPLHLIHAGALSFSVELAWPGLAWPGLGWAGLAWLVGWPWLGLGGGKFRIRRTCAQACGLFGG